MSSIWRLLSSLWNLYNGYEWGLLNACCGFRYGRFLDNTGNLSARIINYMNCQLNLPPSLGIPVSERKATYTEQYRRILSHLGFRKFTNDAKGMLEEWLEEEAIQGALPDELVEKAEGFLLSRQIMSPGTTVLKERLLQCLPLSTKQPL